MHRPLWGVALLYSGGVVASRWIELPLAVLLCLCSGLMAAALLARSARRWLLPLLLIATGWSNLAIRTAIISPNDLRVLIARPPEIVRVRGTLAETPTQTVFTTRGEETWRTHAVVDVDALARGTNWQTACGQLAVTTPDVLAPEYFASRRVEITGVLDQARGPRAPGLFDYAAYLRLRGIHFHLRTQLESDWKLLDGNVTPPFTERFSRWAQRTLQRGLPAEDQPLRLTWAMALGWKTALTDEVSEPFMRTGTMHIFAISGLHVALIAGILVALLRIVQMPRAWCGAIAVPLIWFYTAATGWQSSAIRSAIMMTVIIVGWTLRRPGDLLNSLGAAAFIILVWQPEQLFQASFQLSFFVVLGIALLLPPIQERVHRLLASDPMLPPELRPRWQRWLDTPIRWVALSFATSFASWLGSMPLTAWYFHLFTPVSLVANLVIVPCSSAALACNLGSLLCNGWAPWVGEMFNHAGWFWMWAMIGLSDWFAHLPGAFWHVPSPTFIEMVLYYAVVGAVVSGRVLGEKRWRWFAPAVLLMVATLGSARWLPTRGETTITILPLSGGEAVFVDAPGHAGDLLIDCGSENTAELLLKPFLRAQGVNSLPLLALTHGDLRNVGGWKFISTEFHAQQTATSPMRFRSSGYRAIVAELERTPGRWRILKRGDQLGVWRVLHPAEGDKFENADDGALVLLGEINGTRTLLCSDLGRAGQRLLLEREPNLGADIVVAGLPTKDEPLNDTLLAALQPQAVIITDSEFPVTQRAGKTLRARLARTGVLTLYGSDCDALTLRLHRDGWTIQPMNGDAVNSPIRSR
ncbi:MAG TPA: ComEC/Rec2 family competence protein [Verrucomicrobiae bacterium]|jgi:ComEC/Rec2-related protein